MMRVLAAVGLFVLVGGGVGGALFGVLFSVFMFAQGVASGAAPPPTALLWWLVMIPISALGGVFFGAPSAAATGLVYALGPEWSRRPVAIAGIGAALSAAAATAMAFFRPMWSIIDVVPQVIGFAIAGAVAALVCRRIAARAKF